MSVRISYEIADEVIDTEDIRGGYRIDVDGRRINRYGNEAAFESPLRWKPEYAGEYLHTEFIDLLSKTTRIARGKLAMYEPVTCRFSGTVNEFVFEMLTETHLRIAYRISTDSKPAGDVLPDPESARGYVVTAAEFCSEVLRATSAYFDEISGYPIEFGHEYLEEFEEKLSALETALENVDE
ncbi:hypothetical protein [Halopiger goleimassiliensis]|uniref:hypothetical protein n=1 Tax=Halopiger goleimassiliensis TaxID=1293048 RepID=UPI00067778EF|nr:hypothetical protein [Halopiger goleimassiliensis]